MYPAAATTSFLNDIGRPGELLPIPGSGHDAFEKGTRSQSASDCGVALEAADCCRVQKIGLLNLPGTNGTSREGLSKIELLEAHGPKSLAVHLVTDRGQLTPGQHDLCVQFSNVHDGALTDVGQVEADFTREIRRIRGSERSPG